MHWNQVLLAALAGLEAAQAHDEPHLNFVMPRLKQVGELRQRRPAYEAWNPPSVSNMPRGHRMNRLAPRQADASIEEGDNELCGDGYGKCSVGYCCSSAGYVVSFRCRLIRDTYCITDIVAKPKNTAEHQIVRSTMARLVMVTRGLLERIHPPTQDL